MWSKIKDFKEFETFCKNHGYTSVLEDIYAVFKHGQMKAGRREAKKYMSGWLGERIVKTPLGYASTPYFLFYHLVREVNHLVEKGADENFLKKIFRFRGGKSDN